MSLSLVLCFVCLSCAELSSDCPTGRNNSNQRRPWGMHGGLGSLFKRLFDGAVNHGASLKRLKSRRHSLRVPDEFIISLLCHKQQKSLCYQKTFASCSLLQLPQFPTFIVFVTGTRTPPAALHLQIIADNHPTRDIKVNWHVYGARSYYLGNLSLANFKYIASELLPAMVERAKATEIYDSRLRRLLLFDATRHFIFARRIDLHNSSESIFNSCNLHGAPFSDMQHKFWIWYWSELNNSFA